MRILITGGAGCLGSNLIEHWLPLGHPVAVIDNFATGKREVVPDVQGLTVVEGSVADAGLVEQVFKEFRPEVVIHAAASYKNPDDWQEDIRTNVVGSAIIAKASARHDVQRVVNYQTALSYGQPQTVPIPINHPTAPFTSYGISKTAGESYLMQCGLPLVSLRLANICGPRLAIGPIPTFYKRLKAGQNCFCSGAVRDFLDISDFIELMDRVLPADAPQGVFNVSTGEGYSILEVFKAVAAYLGITATEVPIVPVGADDVPQVVLDPTTTEQAFGWKAQVSFQKTIHNQLRWYDHHGVNDVFSHLTQPVA